MNARGRTDSWSRAIICGVFEESLGACFFYLLLKKKNAKESMKACRRDQARGGRRRVASRRRLRWSIYVVSAFSCLYHRNIVRSGVVVEVTITE